MHKRWLFSGLAICLIIVGLFYFKTVSAVYECERGFKCIYGNANGLKFEVDDGFPINFKSNDINFFDLSDSLIFRVREGNFDIPGNLTVSGATSFDNGAIATNGSGNFITNISTLGIVNTASGIRLSNLVGYSNRLLTVDSVGNLVASTATVYGVVSSSTYATTAGTAGTASLASTSTYATTAGTAKALSLTTNPTDCAAGQYARGITANGSAEGCTAVAGGVGGSGTAGYSAKWTAATTLGNGSIYDNGSGISLGTTTISTKLNISHQAVFNSTTPGTGLYGLHFIGQTTADRASGITWNGGSSGAQAGIYVQGSGAYGTKMYLATTNAYTTGAQTRMMINANGNVGIGDNAPGDKLSVSGVVKGTYLKTSSVVSCTNGIITSATGQLACNSSAFITSAAIPNISFTTIGSAPNANGASVSGHTITLQPANGSYGGVVTAGAQTFAGTKTFSSTIVGNISGTAAALAANPANCPAGQYPLGIAANGAAEGCTAVPTVPSNNITGSAAGTANYVPKYTANYTLANSLLYDNGTNIGIGDTSPSDKLSVNGTIKGSYLKTSSVANCTNGIITSATGQLACNSAPVINGTYTGSGGLQPPSYIPSGKIRFNMMASVPGTSGYQDWLMMDTYTGSDVPYVTMIGVSKTAGNPVGYLAVGAKGGSTWTSTPIITGANIGSQTVASAGTATSLAANPANCAVGQYARGIAANGAAEGCTAINTTDQYWTGTATNLNAATGRTSLGLGALATLGAVATGQITDGTIIDADISASANIASSKIANGTYFITSAGTSGQVWKSDGNGAGVWGDLPSVTGDNLGDHTAEANIKLIGLKGSFWLSGDGDNEGLTVSSNGAVKFSSLAGTGSRMVMASTDGTVLAGGTPNTGSGTANYVTKWTAANTLANGSIYDNGKIGLGNTSPLARLHVSSGGNTLTSYTALFDSSGSLSGAGGVVFAQNSTYGFKMYPVGTSGTSGTLNFSYITKSTGSPLRDNLLVIGANGNVGIGTTSPASKLSVNGDVKVVGSISLGGVLSIGDEAYIANNDVCHSGNNCQNVIDATTVTGNQLLAFNGALAVDSGITYTGTPTTSRTYQFGDGANSKINVGTVDPLYTIGGKRYATYMAGMTGVKEETSGVLSLTKQSAGLFMAKFDFDDDPEGTDIWLFGHTTNLVKNKDVFDQAACLLTANFAGQTWYEKDWQEKTISVFAKPDNSRRENVEVSYRLTAPRFDYLKWTNHSEEPAEGFNLDKLLK